MSKGISLEDQIAKIDAVMEKAEKTGASPSQLLKGIELKSDLLGHFKDASGGENLNIYLDIDSSRVCFLLDKVKKLEEENQKLKAENQELKTIYGVPSGPSV